MSTPSHRSTATSSTATTATTTTAMPALREPRDKRDYRLYYGDNLTILREKIATASVDLIYLDPPFNSNADYNVIFKETSGQQSAAQIQAFTDTWHWTLEADRAREEVLTSAPENVARMLDALCAFIGHNDLTAYLVMMTQRLIELHRVLKPTGSLYLHCDPTASHYLKIVLDSIFGPTNFRNEIIWKRTSAHSSAKRYGPVHDTILFYSKSETFLWNQHYTPYDEEYIATWYRHQDANGRLYRLSDLTGAGTRNGETGHPWRGVDVTSRGRHWMYPPSKLDELDTQGLIYWPSKGEVPSFKRYLDTMPGVPLQDVWIDIPPMHNLSSERLGYPTQKPLTLLERIISASSNPGDVVLDPFCGCGTAICAAEHLGRRWTGIDITHLAVSLMKSRLKDMFSLDANSDYLVEGEPTDLAGARQLAQDSRYQFQYWAVSLVEATAQAQDQQGKKKGADKGIDGLISFIDGANRHRETVIVQVKSGHVSSQLIRDLRGTLEREKAALALFISLEPLTKDMRDEAAAAGFYHSDLWPGPKGDRRWPRIQLRTIEELLSGHPFELPPRPAQYKQAARVAPTQPAAPGLWEGNLTPSPSPPGEGSRSAVGQADWRRRWEPESGEPESGEPEPPLLAGEGAGGEVFFDDEE